MRIFFLRNGELRYESMRNVAEVNIYWILAIN